MPITNLQARLHSTDDKVYSLKIANTKSKEDMAHFRQDIFMTLPRIKKNLKKLLTKVLSSTILNVFNSYFQEFLFNNFQIL
jgi:peptidoglycan hydrolase CwlO-like protein